MSITLQRIPTPSVGGSPWRAELQYALYWPREKKPIPVTVTGKLAPEAHLLSIRIPLDEVGHLTGGGHIEIAYDADDQDIDVFGELPDRLTERWQEWATRNWPTAAVDWLADYEQGIRQEIAEVPPKDPDDEVDILDELNEVLRQIQVARMAYQHSEWQAAVRIGKDFAGTPDQLAEALDGVFA